MTFVPWTAAEKLLNSDGYKELLREAAEYKVEEVEEAAAKLIEALHIFRRDMGYDAY